MRSKNEIFLSAVNDGTFQTSSGNLAILEALLDIRDLLVKEEELASLETAYQTLYDLHQEIIEELEETKIHALRTVLSSEEVTPQK
jgi:hypothetical protein